MRVAIVAHRPSHTNLALSARRWNGNPIELLSPREALLKLRHGDVALARLDVRDDLDGVEDGLWALERLAAAGVRVLNPPAALLSVHDKLLTARCLRRAGLPHPQTTHIDGDARFLDIPFPVVLKPRFGSWGRDVFLCQDRGQFERALETVAFRSWFRSGGVLAQDLIPPLGHDLRLIVAAGEVVGAGKRTAAPGEWRTNVALGASIASVAPSPVACDLARAAAAASGLDLVGVDLLPTGPGGLCVLELNAAADFRPVYSFPMRNVSVDALSALSAAREPSTVEALAAQA